MVRMSHSVLICEIREIRSQKLFPAIPGIIEDQRRFVNFDSVIDLHFCLKNGRQLHESPSKLTMPVTIRSNPASKGTVVSIV